MSATQMTVSGAAGRYAHALFDLARDGDLLDRVGEELAALDGLIRDNADLRRLATSPLYRRRQQADVILKLAETAGFSDLTRRFLGVVATNRRLADLGAIVTAFAALLADLRGEMRAQVNSATPLSEEQLAAIREKLSAYAERDVTLAADTDEALLGGMVVRLGSQMIDNSLKTKIENLQVAMKAGSS